MTLSVPVPLADHHELGEFSSGITALDDWLKKRARTNQAGGASRTYVTCKGNRVIGYYAVASGAVKMVEASSRFRRNMPDPIPVAVLGRLAVDQAYHARGIGRALVRDAGLRILQAAEILGIKGIVVHAISDDARAFYITIGFEPSPVEPLTLMVTLADLSESIG
ncbi:MULTISPECIES: GNAT family N-acetyltransferase [unclassified Mesorhizobium]|uniref:GNAT family N-acetyltransferase n=1 Tax=unclassified Mesorhizobium TaxID=325217 RepID=UPI000FCB24CB|nr:MULTISPECIES: GNAT family N-acetyltransferase [unclassified Mesorhizobium]RUZ76823.1 GNAT family N-acetyltransferase [Mesorhizobium sp. M7A.F.Ca.US.003.02.2.1]RUY92420.1 GNAT family N-acetyltransferase [Mesorhizobium sp. M7A.F.Ca.CA.001.12.2.1]RUZ23411.1 GNAT family N-acetyltransferase [Mesorhizobium sp. M7A.F.Ca.US.007.01.2.1]RUZ45641.1 GNAT family N-acetyltransferase [Mesorhizobium sp. M7A.F.Ca.US.003.02.1.1]RUZ66138.1 GNAT family N-acetyltransferase [Mesorhizobium sp. M7A.F.Ca.US.007.01.